jgi:hypothetical protein
MMAPGGLQERGIRLVGVSVSQQPRCWLLAAGAGFDRRMMVGRQRVALD